MTMADRITYLEDKIKILEYEIQEFMSNISILESKIEELDYKVNDPIGSRSHFSKFEF